MSAVRAIQAATIEDDDFITHSEAQHSGDVTRFACRQSTVGGNDPGA